ncbi:hypothetical protein LWI28_022041 [Acer negundo]|uniref:Tryptophan synthase n=1 Tax=Acer negundo TaxID=4023 RepID=A0AAD5J7C3_ACENE|nr:hypothetical protein LWI28_022041 [Acer negundo]
MGTVTLSPWIAVRRVHCGGINRRGALRQMGELRWDRLEGGVALGSTRGRSEDLNHTGAHKINNAIIAESTRAGQHGVATATVRARFGLKCNLYMGAQDMERQSLNVFRMQLLGAEVSFKRLSRLEGIIPALEISHALAYLEELCPTLPNGTKVVLNCSGRGNKDVQTAIKYLQV